MDNTSVHNPQKENFDLLDSIIGFFRWIKRGLKAFFVKGIGHGSVWLLNVHIRYFYIFLVLLLGLGTWAYLEKDTEPERTEYIGTAFVYCNGFDNFTLDQAVLKLDLAIWTGGLPYLMENLGLSAKECRLLKSLTVGIGVDTDNDGIPNSIKYEKKFEADKYEKGEVLEKKKEGEIMERYPKAQKIADMAVLELKTKAVNKETFDKLAQAILDYLNNLPDLQRMYKVYAANLEYTLAAYNTQIMMLDSLQSIEYLENSRKQKMAYGRDLYMTAMLTTNRGISVDDVERLSSPTTFYYGEILTLVQERNELQARFEMADCPVSTLSTFVPTRHRFPDYWYIWPIVIAVAGTGLIGGCIDNRRKIGAYLKEQHKIR